MTEPLTLTPPLAPAPAPQPAAPVPAAGPSSVPGGPAASPPPPAPPTNPTPAVPPAGAPAPQPQAAPAWQQAAKDYGLELPADEALAARELARQAAEARQYQQWLQHLLSQQQPQAPQGSQTPGERPWWEEQLGYKEPEWDPALSRYLKTDEQGNVTGPPELVARFLAYKQTRDQNADQFLANPYSFIEKPVEVIAERVVQKALEKHLASREDQSLARGFVDQNASWLFQKSATGEPLTQTAFDPQSGRMVQKPVLTPMGQFFQAGVAEAERRGIASVREQQAYALERLELELLRQQARQQQPTTQAPTASLQPGAPLPTPTPNHGGSTTGAVGTSGSIPQNQRLSLGERLRTRLGAPPRL